MPKPEPKLDPRSAPPHGLTPTPAHAAAAAAAHAAGVAPSLARAIAFALAGIALAVSLPASTARAGEPPPADLVLRGGTVLTVDPAQPVAGALAVRDGRIALVGDDAAVARLVGPRTEVVDLAGACVVPGLIDAHAHLLGLGLAALEVDLTGARSFDEVCERVAAAARAKPAGAWVTGRGFDQNDWPDTAMPTHERLSAAVPDHPVCLTRVDGHAVLVNARALALAGLDRDSAAPPGGEILRGPDGAPTGLLTDNAIALVERLIPAPDRAERARAYERAARMCAEVGLTGVHDAGVDADDADLLVSLAEEGRLPLRVYVLLSGATPDAVLARGPRVGLAGGLVTIRAMKLMADGALGSRGARLLEPYADRPGHRGSDVTSPEGLRAALRRAREHGFQVGTHAIGDAAVRGVLDLYEEAFAEGGVDDLRAARWRVEHAQVIDPADLDRFARLGVLASMQPTHATSDMPWAEARLGAGRLAGAYAWRTLLGRGARLAFGSDFPVESHDPRKGIYAAVTRQDEAGAPAGGWRAHERLTVDEALHAFTAGAAYAAFEEDEVGRIAPGLRADLVVLEADPRRVEPGHLPSLRIVRRYLGGVER